MSEVIFEPGDLVEYMGTAVPARIGDKGTVAQHIGTGRGWIAVDFAGATGAYAPVNLRKLSNHAQRLFIFDCGDGFTCLGFDVAETRRAAVLNWIGEPVVYCAPGSLESLAGYKAAMEAGRAYASKAGRQCPAELTAELVGREGKRVTVREADGSTRRFYVGRSTGWMPCHLECTRLGDGGFPVHLSPGARIVS